MPRQLIVIMGPSGCGKSRVSSALSQTIGAPMLEGDDFHSESNRAKMSAGSPLNDIDRAGWLDSIWQTLSATLAPRVVLACSALTPYVQSRLREASERTIHFVLLDAPREVLEERMSSRAGHFMPTSLLDSQLQTLVTPDDATIVDACKPVEVIVAQIVAALEHKT